MKQHDDFIAEALTKGESFASIGRQLGVSRQRIHQIALRLGIERQWKEKPISAQRKRKQEFSLGPEVYAEASLKYTRKKQNCRANGIPFDVKFEDIPWVSHCPILGLELNYFNIEGTRTETSVSFDKIDPSKGYVPGNVTIVSWRANRIKNDGTAEEHMKIAEYINRYK